MEAKERQEKSFGESESSRLAKNLNQPAVRVSKMKGFHLNKQPAFSSNSNVFVPVGLIRGRWATR